MCALQGSQNYNLADEKSDIDVKVFVMPNFEDLYYCQKISKTYETKYGKAEVKDIRLLVDLIKKMNPTYLEILATNYFIADEEFFFIFKNVQKYLEEIIYFKETSLLKAILGSIRGEMKNLEQVDGSYKTKEFGHILRLYELFNNLFKKGMAFKAALYNEGEKREYLLKAKREVLFETEIAKQETERIYEEVQKMLDSRNEGDNLAYANETIEKQIEIPIKGYIYDYFGNSF